MNKKIGHLLALMTIIIWSSTFIVSKVLLNYLTPGQILLCRFFIASIFLTILSPNFKKSSKDVELLFIISSLLLVLYFIFENTSLMHTYVSNVSLILATIPVISLIISSIISDDVKLSFQTVIGFIMAYIGVIFIVLKGHKFEVVSITGDIIAFGAALSFSLYSIVLKKAENNFSVIDTTKKIFYYGAIILFAVNWSQNSLNIFESLNGKVIISILYLGIAASSFAFIMWNKSIKIIGAVKTTQYIYLIPPVTTFMSYIFIHEPVTIFSIAGSAIILFGIYIAQLPNNKNTVSVKKYINIMSLKSKAGFL